MTFKPARLLALVLISAALPVMAQTLVTVNGKPIPSSMADMIAKQATQQAAARGQKEAPADLRDKIKDFLIDQTVLAQEAERLGLTKNEDLKNQLAFTRDKILANAVVEDHLKKTPISEDAMKAEYERLKADAPQNEYHARHILVKDEELAKALIVKLKGGAKFEDLAKENSTDASAANGGDLDWNVPTGYVKPFSDAMVGLKKGMFTETPVHTDFGYHIIKLEDIRPAKFPSYEELKPRINQELQQKEVENFRKSLHDKAKIK